MSSRRLVVSLLTAAAAFHAQADVVAPNSHYFQNWVFTSMARPPTFGVPVAVGTPNSAISLAGRTLTVTNVGPHNAGDEFNVFGSGQLSWGAGSQPAGINSPSPTPAMVDINRGTGTLMFDKPLPKGAAIFLTDIDGREFFDLRFVDCAGQPVDAGGFTPLQISLNTPPAYPANNMPDFSIEGVAPARYWRVADPIAAGGNVNQATNGLIIDSDAVCGVQVEGNRARNSGGGAQFSFGLPAASLLNAAKAVALVNGQAPATPAITRPGDVVEYGITLTNPETVALTLAAGAIAETVPANTTLEDGLDFTCAASAAGSACASIGAITVPAGGSATVRMRVRVDGASAAPSITNTVAISGLDCAAAGNQCTVTTATAAPANVPTVGEWALACLSMLAAALGVRRLRRHG